MAFNSDVYVICGIRFVSVDGAYLLLHIKKSTKCRSYGKIMLLFCEWFGCIVVKGYGRVFKECYKKGWFDNIIRHRL